MTHDTRQTLIAKIRNKHDEQSWDEFVHYYESYITKVIANLKVNYSDVEDLAQNVLLVLWEKLPEFEYRPSQCKFRSWMNNITRNIVMNYKRKQVNYQRKQVNYQQHLSNSVKNCSSEENPLLKMDEMAEREWRIHISRLALENISSEFRGKAIECFSLFLKGKTIEEVCSTLEIEKNSAYVLKSRILERIIPEIHRLDQELS